MKINNKIINEIKDKAKSFFIDSSGCHDWTHVERVYNLAIRIAKKEKANLDIVKIAAYLHDIGRKEEMEGGGKICHAEKGAELAEEILLSHNLDKEIVENIKHCVLSHRYRNEHKPKTIEAKILFDADKLDSIGAVGIARDFLFAGYLGCNYLYTGNEKKLSKQGKKYEYTKEDTALLEYYYKLKKVKSKIITETGKQIAEERHTYMVEFFKRFELEVQGVL
ncbi:MAG: HD domain-containing protein [Candidatus Paceibacterota bacterium]|jgi:uncharacterized protein